MSETRNPGPSTGNNLKRITVSAVNRLRRRETWRTPYLFFDEQRQRLHISSDSLPYPFLGVYSEDNIEQTPAGIRRVVFHGLSPMDTYLDDATGSRLRMIRRRAVAEIAKKTPSWRIKNLLYGYLGVGISDWKTTIIAPNVFVDYIYPELIESIGRNTFIGEEAMLTTHFAYPDRMEIGIISIGNNCLIGVRSLICPGVAIGDNATIGAYAVVTDNVPSGATLHGLRSG